MIEIFTIIYNEEVILQKFINHYRERFPNCEITIYDNMSTDNSRQIAIKNGCKIIDYDSNNQIRDDLYLEIKNNCWKNANTDWVLICDADEFLDINEEDLIKEDNKKTTIISAEGWNMINTEDNPYLELKDIKWGSRAKQYDKYYLFNKKYITEINYTAGCHFANPKGVKKMSDNIYKLYHFRALSEDYVVNKNIIFGKRLSKQNLKNNWGFHYLDSEETIRRNYKVYQDKANLKQVIDDNSNLFDN